MVEGGAYRRLVHVVTIVVIVVVVIVAEARTRRLRGRSCSRRRGSLASSTDVTHEKFFGVTMVTVVTFIN